MRRRLTDRPEIVAHDIVTRAMHRSGGDDFDGVAWIPALEELTRSLDREARLTVAGRRRVRGDLVEALAGRRRVAREHVIPEVIVTGIDTAAVGELVLALDGLDDAGAAFESSFASLRFEERWHVPAYAEWLAADPLTDVIAGVAAGRRIVGAVELAEHLDAVRAAAPRAVTVVVESDVEEVADVTSRRSAVARRHDSDEVDDAKVARYWSWRLGEIARRLADEPVDLRFDAAAVRGDPSAAARAITDR